MNHKIMLIEDDRTMISLLETLLSLEGFQVITAKEEVFDTLLLSIVKEQPDAILLDVHLRQGSGLDLLNAIRSTSSLDNVRVIMCSGMDYKQECLQNGAQGFIMKPYMPDDLIKMVAPSLN